jgi:hemolysin III
MTDPAQPTVSDPEPRGEGFLSTELADTATHAVGLGLSIAGLAILVVMASKYGTARHIVACSIYGATLVFLYLSSTLYHSVERTRAEPVLRLFDHAAIYLLIAGTYTPFTLVTLRGGWGWSLFGVIWGLAALGILYTLLFSGRFKLLSVALYLGMGWLCVIAVKPMLDAFPMAGIGWLLAGGLAYTAGVVFYLWRGIPHHHAIWHLFVMIGSACHFFSVMFFVIPRG